MKDTPPHIWQGPISYEERREWSEEPMPHGSGAPKNEVQHGLLSLFFPNSNVAHRIEDLAVMFGTKYAQMSSYLNGLACTNLIERDPEDMKGSSYKRVRNPSWNWTFHARVTNFYQRKEESITIAGSGKN